MHTKNLPMFSANKRMWIIAECNESSGKNTVLYTICYWSCYCSARFFFSSSSSVVVVVVVGFVELLLAVFLRSHIALNRAQYSFTPLLPSHSIIHTHTNTHYTSQQKIRNIMLSRFHVWITMPIDSEQMWLAPKTWCTKSHSNATEMHAGRTKENKNARNEKKTRTHTQTQSSPHIYIDNKKSTTCITLNLRVFFVIQFSIGFAYRFNVYVCTNVRARDINKTEHNFLFFLCSFNCRCNAMWAHKIHKRFVPTYCITNDS